MPEGQFHATRARPSLLRRLRALRNLEWFNAPFLVVILSLTWPDRSFGAVWQRLAAYLLVAGLLVVGGWYWQLKVRQIGEGQSSDSGLVVLSKLQRVAQIVLAVATLALAASWMARLGVTGDRRWATAFLALAWVEYVNYFHLQLMYDTRTDLARLRRTGRLRKSWMATDLEKIRRSQD